MTGRIVSHYKVLEKLGGGGMGVVYKARDLRLDRFVALKFLPPHCSAEEERKQRFIREAKAASSLDHPNICTIHDIDEVDGLQLFIAMAFYEGESLTKKIDRGPLAPGRAVDLGIQIGQGLQAAHENGIVHRDIKPDNVMVTLEGVVKIVDFGLAKTGGHQMTPSSVQPGTPAYMSPEQLLGPDEVDHRTDIWSFGMVIYEMLTGQLPFDESHQQALVYSILNEAPATLRERCPELPEDLERVVMRALEKRPEQRYQQIDELLADLRPLREQLELLGSASSPAEDRRSSPVPRRRGRGRAKRRVLAVAAVIATLLVVLTTLAPAFRQRALTQACLWAPNWLEVCQLPAHKHLGVLPFDNQSEGSDGKAFCDGLAESLVDKLRQIAPYDDSLCVHPPRSDGEVFGATVVLKGSMACNGDSVRVTASLVKAGSGVPLRTLSHEGETKNVSYISLLEDGIVDDLAEMLEVELPQQARLKTRAGGTAIPSAFEAYLRGLGYLKRDELELAESKFRQALKHDQEYTLAHTALADVYRRNYDLTNDVKWLEQAREVCGRGIERNLASAHHSLGLIEARAGRYDRAAETFRKAVALNPVDLASRRELAAAYKVMGLVEHAESVYRDAVELRPGCWEIHNALAVFLDGYGRYTEAEQQFRLVVALAPKNPIGYNNLGLVLTKMDRFAEAAKMLETSLRLRPRRLTYSNLGLAYFRQGCYEAAAKMMEGAVSLGTDDYFVWNNLAEAYLEVPELKHRASGAFRKSRDLALRQLGKKPTDANLRMYLANSHAHLGQKEDALREISEALRLAPDDINVLFRAALVHELIGNRDLALGALSGAMKGGYSIDEMRKAQSLEALRRDPRYQELDPLGVELRADGEAAKGCPG